MTVEDDVARAGDPATDPADLTALAVSRRVAVRAAVARNPGTPLEVLRTLACDKRFGVQLGVAQSDRQEAQLAAAASTHVSCRLVVAQHPVLPDDLLDLLLADVVDVREQLAENTRVRRVLEALLADPAPAVRIRATGNPGITAADCERLAVDNHPRVRAAVAYSRRTPREIVERLAGDRIAAVRTAALSRLPVSAEDRANVARHRRELADLRRQRDSLPLDPAACDDPTRWRERIHVIDHDDAPRFRNGPFSGGWLFTSGSGGEQQLYEMAEFTAWDSLMQDRAWADWYEAYGDTIYAGDNFLWFEDRIELSIRRSRRPRGASAYVPVRDLRSTDDLIGYLRRVFVAYLTAIAAALDLPEPPHVPS